MASHRDVLERSSNQFLSPAKVFAKLKSKVQRDNEAVRETHGATGCWKDNHRFALDAALTLSPIKSPQKRVDDLHLNFSRSAVGEMTLGHVTGDAFRRGRTLTKRHLMESTAVFCPLLPSPHTESVPPRTPVNDHLTPSTVISPMAKRLRSRHIRQQQVPRVPSPSEPQPMEGLGVGGCSFPADTDQIYYQPRTAQLRTEMKCCSVSIQRLMSPAKMFAYMKQRENRRQRQDVQSVRRHTEEPSEGRDSPLLSAAEQMEGSVSWTASESPSPVPVVGLESTDGRSSRDAALSPQLVLLEDPVVLNTPQISIPKKHQAMFKPNQLPSESVIHLKEWFLRRTRKGLFVDGVRKDDNVPWNSNIIVERVSTSVLKTVSGRVYILVGKMKHNVDTEFPPSLLKKFLHGFPPNWKELYETFVSAASGSRDTQTTSEQKSSKTKETPEASAAKAPVRPRRRPVQTSDARAPSSSLTNVSRSGRVIKPPLEYWRGGRVLLDAQMNVTVFECYDTSICSPPVTSFRGPRTSQRRVSPSCSEGRKQQESTSNPIRASHCTPPWTNVHPEQRPPSPPAGRKRTVGSSTDNNRVSVWELSLDESPVERKKRNTKDVGKTESSRSEEEEEEGEGEGEEQQQSREPLKKTARAKKHGSPTNGTQHKHSKPSPATQAFPKTARAGRRPPAGKDRTPSAQEDEDWTEEEPVHLQRAVSRYPRYATGSWEEGAMMVGTRSAEEGLIKHRPHKNTQPPPKKTSKTTKEKVSGHPVTAAPPQQVRLPREDTDDVFTCQQTPPGSRDQDSSLTSSSRCRPRPHVTGMMGFHSRKTRDVEYIFQLERKRRKAAAQSFTPSLAMGPCVPNPGSDTFVVREMFPEEVGVLDASGGGEDFSYQ